MVVIAIALSLCLAHISTKRTRSTASCGVPIAVRVTYISGAWDTAHNQTGCNSPTTCRCLATISLTHLGQTSGSTPGRTLRCIRPRPRTRPGAASRKTFHSSTARSLPDTLHRSSLRRWAASLISSINFLRRTAMATLSGGGIHTAMMQHGRSVRRTHDPHKMVLFIARRPIVRYRTTTAQVDIRGSCVSTGPLRRTFHRCACCRWN
mmetsp:Transcript_74525/g.170921  ORF Transcript_74525/g.170921 Transcript_74525/m.170921 type:complete len:207 (+) Transcript_74525:263-883(+)